MDVREGVKRRSVLGAMAMGAGGLAVGGVLATPRAGSAGAAPGDAAGSGGYLVGCGRADMTGAVAGQGMMGYSEPDQVSEGILSRCYARAYIIGDQAGGNRVVFVNADVCCLFQSVHLGVMSRLKARFGDLYNERNVNLNATHNHNSCGGTAWDYAYTLAAYGFKKKSYEAEVNGIVNAIVKAHADLAPGTISLGRGELHNASANRSKVAFDLNPSADKSVFPEAIDPAVTVLRLRKNGSSTDSGQITWFATHGTSLADRNRLISGDNKGYASYLAEGVTPGLVASFPQTNAGDMTPNLWLRKLMPSGPTADNRTNCLIIGERQHTAGQAALATAAPMTRSGVESVVRYVDFSKVTIDAKYTPEGKAARTGPACMGAAAIGTSTEDNYNQPVPLFDEGQKIPKSPLIPDWLRSLQAPKLIILPLGLLPPAGWIPSILPIQIVRIGALVLAAAPAEFTIVAGLRVRRTVASALGISIDNVLLQGYANGYSQYVTTPEEYDSQQYEGGETQFGRWTLSAYMQEFDALAKSMVSGVSLGRGPAPIDKSNPQPDFLAGTPADAPVSGHKFGDVLTQPSTTYAPRATMKVDFVGAHPTNNFRTDGTYFTVEKQNGSQWATVYDDHDWCTEMHWARPDGSKNTSVVTVQWTIPDTTSGTFRIRYFGDSKGIFGGLSPFTGTSGQFTVA